MSALDELRQVSENEEVIEAPEVEEVPELEDETVEEVAEESEEPEEETEVDEIDLEIEGEEEQKPAKRNPEEVLLHKLTKEKKKRQAANSEAEELKAKVERLEQMLQSQGQAPQQPQQQAPAAERYGYPPVPILYSNGLNTPEEYNKAYQKWMADCRAIDQMKAQDSARIESVNQAKQRATEAIAAGASKFIAENKLNEDKAIDSIQEGIRLLDQATGIDNAGIDLLSAVGEGGEKVAYYIGRNPAVADKVKKLFEEDPRGLKASMFLKETALKLKPKKAHISKAPAPDEPINGDTGSNKAVTSALQKRYDNETDFAKLKKIREEAKQRGIQLKY